MPNESTKDQLRQYADPIDEEALHDQLLEAISSEEAAFAALPDQYAPGEGVAYDLPDPVPPKK